MSATLTSPRHKETRDLLDEVDDLHTRLSRIGVCAAAAMNSVFDDNPDNEIAICALGMIRDEIRAAWEASE